MTSSPSASGSRHPELATVIKFINDEVRKLRSLTRMSTKQRKSFSTDLALVGLAARTGCLVDTVTPQNAVEVFSGLLSRLRLAYPIFESVMHVYETAADQSFFVHVPSLLEKGFADITDSPFMGDNSRSTGKVTFVYLKKDGPQLSTAPPSRLAVALQSLLMARSYLPTSITLPANLTSETMVPLAALLLEYPVAYVPTFLDSQVPFLNNVPLDIYECILVIDDQSLPLLKFSCPSGLAEAHPDRLGSSSIIAYLVENFKDRLEKSFPGATLRVIHSRETRDRLAL